MALDLEAELKAAADLVSEQSLQELVKLLWSSDRHFTFPAFQATARHVSAKLREWNVRARTFELPADGRTVFGDWKMPLGWDCAEARLEIHEPLDRRGQVLVDLKKQPLHVIMWSGPTPPQGLTADLIRIEDRAELEAKRDAVRGKIVYTPSDPRAFKKLLADAGALAVVTSYCRSAHLLPNECFWVNGWSDDPQGWAFHDGDAPFPGLVVPPAVGVELDILLERGRVKVKLKVDSRYLETPLPVICGYLDAGLQEEVLAIAHGMEPGANDNASGAAVVLESLRVLEEGTRTGRFAPLRRAVRGLIVNECYGTIGFGVQNPGILRRIQAGVNWDSVGRCQEHTDAAFRHLRGPDASASVADTLLELLLEAWLPQTLPYLRIHLHQPYGLVDNAYNDPAFGVPCPVLLSRDRFWHTSADTPKDLSGRALHAFATVSVAYLHFLATAAGKEAMWLAQQTVRRYGRRIEDLGGRYALELEAEGANRPFVLARAADHLTYVRQVCEIAVMSAKRFMLREERAPGHLALLKLLRHPRRLVELQKRRLKELAGCEEGRLPPRTGLGELAELRPYKKFPGTPTYSSVPLEERAGIASPMWNARVHAALFWADGRLTLAEIARRVSYEFDQDDDAELAEHFRFMGEKGLLQWLQPGEAIPKPPKPEKAEGEALGPREETLPEELPVEAGSHEVEEVEPDEGGEKAAAAGGNV
jgi:aminopeptidase-like protein